MEGRGPFLSFPLSARCRVGRGEVGTVFAIEKSLRKESSGVCPEKMMTQDLAAIP